jgi:hypothetical protein
VTVSAISIFEWQCEIELHPAWQNKLEFSSLSQWVARVTQAVQLSTTY